MKKETCFHDSRGNAAAWCSLLILLLILFFSHTYNDILVTMKHGIQSWEILFRGDFFRMYSGDYVTASGNVYFTVVQGRAYSFLVYLIFAIWNIPLALLDRFTSVDVMNNIWCLAWGKLMIVAALAATLKTMQILLCEMKVSGKRQELAQYLLLSSAILISAAFINSQYDLLGLPLQMMGIVYLLRRDDKRFIAFFAVALCFKAFALVTFLPLLLLIRKRIAPILRDLIFMTLPYFALEALFAIGGRLGSSATFLTSMTSMLFSGDVSGISLFVLLYAALCLWCYSRDPEEGLTQRGFVIWVCFAANSAFFAFCTTYPYWKVLMAPYWVLLIALSRDEMLERNLLLEGIGMPALVVSQMIQYPWCFWGNTMKPMLLSRLMPYRVLERVGRLQALFEAQPHFALVVSRSVFVAAAVLLAWCNRPEKLKSAAEGETPVHTDVWVFRFTLSAAVLLLPIISLFI